MELYERVPLDGVVNGQTFFNGLLAFVGVCLVSFIFWLLIKRAEKLQESGAEIMNVDFDIADSDQDDYFDKIEEYRNGIL